jgi:hypothetical protein
LTAHRLEEPIFMSSGYTDPEPGAVDYYSRLGVPTSAEPEDIEDHVKKHRAKIEHEGGDAAANFRDALKVLTDNEKYNNYKTFHKRFGSAEIATRAYEKWQAQNRPEPPETWMPPKEIVEEMDDPTEAAPADGSTTDAEQPDQADRRGQRGGRGKAGGRGEAGGKQKSEGEQKTREKIEPGNPNHPASSVNTDQRKEQSAPSGQSGSKKSPPGELSTSRYLIKLKDKSIDILPTKYKSKTKIFTIQLGLIKRICTQTEKVKSGYWTIFTLVLLTSTTALLSIAAGGSAGGILGVKNMFALAAVPVVSGAIVEDYDELDNPLFASVSVVTISGGLAALYATVIGGIVSIPVAVAVGGGGSAAGTAIGTILATSITTPISYGILAAIVAGIRL